jgi:hypothetical protein
MARPTKYNAEIAKKICDAIRVGATHELAAAYAGINQDTLTNWKHRYSDFSDAVKEAEGAAAVKWLAHIEKAAQDGNWQAAAWKLERKYPREYGRRVIQSFEDIPPESVPDMTDEQLDTLYDKLIPSRRSRA